ncbi:MAG TPA: aldo/keto reductase [Thermodesulfobacteriota bacterium]|nr:aldo/keto reductase [Thermodesulfobacteriota bacterium]
MIEKRLFGRTGHMSTATIFGGAAFIRGAKGDAERTLEVLLKYGVNHIDTAPRYGDSELLIGPWMARHRKDFFLATKTGKRTYEEAREEIHRSLERLKTDRLDMIQFHGLQHPDEWDTALGPGGALEAAIEAREQGLVRFIGVTGHGWMIAALHKRALQRFDFDSVLLPYNYSISLNERYRKEFQDVVDICRKRNTAVQTIKSLARGPWGITPPNRNTWYQPLEEQDDIDKAVHWVLGHPDIFLNTVGDVNLLPKVLDAASRYEKPPASEEMEEMARGKSISSIFGIGT